MQTSFKWPVPAVIGAAAALTCLAASVGATQGQPSAPKDDADPAAFARDFYVTVLSGDPAACAVFTSEGRRDFVTDMHPAADCREAVDLLGNAVGADHLGEVIGSYTYTVTSREDDLAVVRIDFGASADLMYLHRVDDEWRVGRTLAEDPAPVQQ